ncbi:MAG: O-acetylhomoserine aminocarboxypropyltransferase [Myxococcota bacterium]
MNARYGFSTRSVHAGAAPDPHTGARNVPIYQTASYVFHDADHAASLFNLQDFGFVYTRLGNPTVSALEERVASLEGGRAAVACASGHAAQLLAVFPLLTAGDNFVASNALYGGSVTQFGHTFAKFGWNCKFVDAQKLDEVEANIDDRTKFLFCETISNPAAVITDIAAWADLAHRYDIPLLVDNTMASPYLCRPFEFGADIVVHSLTKFLSGHGTSMGGVVVESGRFDWSASGKFPGLTTPDPAYHGLTFYETFGDFGYSMKLRAVALRDLGPTLSPTNAFHILTGIETLPLRMARHVENAQKVAAYLSMHSKVRWVAHPSLADHPQHALAIRQLPRGAGSVFTFGVVGGYEAGLKVVESCELFSHLANVGDTRSLILHPASTTHRQLSDDQRKAAGAGPEVVRLSIGIEDPEDLIADLDAALTSA